MKRVRIPPKCDEAELSYEHNDGQEAHYAEKVDLYDKLIKTNPNLERKGDTIPFTSLNGDMFTSVQVWLGGIQKEYATVPDALLQRTGELSKYLELSYAYA